MRPVHRQTGYRPSHKEPKIRLLSKLSISLFWRSENRVVVLVGVVVVVVVVLVVIVVVVLLLLVAVVVVVVEVIVVDRFRKISYSTSTIEKG